MYYLYVFVFSLHGPSMIVISITLREMLSHLFDATTSLMESAGGCWEYKLCSAEISRGNVLRITHANGRARERNVNCGGG